MYIESSTNEMTENQLRERIKTLRELIDTGNATVEIANKLRSYEIALKRIRDVRSGQVW